MLSQRASDASETFTRRDLTRLIVAAILLVATLTGIFALDLFPQRLSVQEGDVAAADIVAPRTYEYVSQIQTAADRDAATKDVEPVYDYTPEKGKQIATDQLAAFRRLVAVVDGAFDPTTKEAERTALLENAIKGLSNSRVYMLAGLIAYARKDLPVAVDRFDVAFKVDPSACDAVWMSGLVSIDQSELAVAGPKFTRSMTCFVSAASALRQERLDAARKVVTACPCGV